MAGRYVLATHWGAQGIRHRNEHWGLGLTLASAAGQLGQWPSVISRPERGLIRNDNLAMTCPQWLTEQTAKITIWRLSEHQCIAPVRLSAWGKM